jgi:dephospho-CoA kinase
VPAPPFVGLTGGIGAGKSEALAALERLGAATLSTDAVVHELYADPEVRDASSRAGAPRSRRRRRRPRRDRRAARSPTPRSARGSRPALAARRRARAPGAPSRRREPPPRALVVEVPLLFEAGMEGAFDTTVAVVADEEVRARRAGERGHEVVDERAARQLTQDEKAELADHVVANSGTIEELEQTLSELLEKLRAIPR